MEDPAKNLYPCNSDFWNKIMVLPIQKEPQNFIIKVYIYVF